MLGGCRGHPRTGPNTHPRTAVRWGLCSRAPPPAPVPASPAGPHTLRRRRQQGLAGQRAGRPARASAGGLRVRGHVRPPRTDGGRGGARGSCIRGALPAVAVASVASGCPPADIGPSVGFAAPTPSARPGQRPGAELPHPRLHASRPRGTSFDCLSPHVRTAKSPALHPNSPLPRRPPQGLGWQQPQARTCDTPSPGAGGGNAAGALDSRPASTAAVLSRLMMHGARRDPGPRSPSGLRGRPGHPQARSCLRLDAHPAAPSASSVSAGSWLPGSSAQSVPVQT